MAGLTQHELGERIAVSSDSVSKWERGETQPRVAHALAVAEVLGCDVRIVFPEVSDGGRQ